MRWYFNRAKDVLKLGATCASSGIAMALRDTNIAERKSQ